LQKIVSQLVILGKNISQEDLNLKFLRSLPFEWNTHVVVWRNKPDLDIMTFDDLYNNFKIVKKEASEDCKSVGYLSYHDVSPPPTWLFSPQKLDLSNSGLEEFQQPEFKGYRPMNSKSVCKDISNKFKEYPYSPLIKDKVSDSKDCSVESPIVVEKKTVVLVAKI
nr:ribonuclease H-like domain-containing protein [Tanacetum cinerariifolium]